MRIDKWLKVSRLIKRREIAKELCDAGDVFLNGKKAKAMAEVKEGDLLILIMGKRRIAVKVMGVRPFASKEDSKTMYSLEGDSLIQQ